MSIFNKVTKTFQWGQQTVTMETGEIARQSGGADTRDQRPGAMPFQGCSPEAGRTSVE